MIFVSFCRLSTANITNRPNGDKYNIKKSLYKLYCSIFGKKIFLIIGDQTRENQKDIIVCALAEDFLIKKTSFISHLLPEYFHFSKMRLVKKYSPLLTVVLYPPREDHCIKQRRLSQFLSSVFVSGFVFLMKAMTKPPIMMRQFLKAMNWFGGEKLFACRISTQLGDQERTQEPVKEHFISCFFMANTLDF